MSHRLHEQVEGVRSNVARGYSQAEDMVARNPAPSILLSFGLGFGVGLVLTSILSRREESWYDWAGRQARETGESAHHVQDMMRHLPEAFHNLAESIRSLPDTIGHQMSAVRARR